MLRIGLGPLHSAKARGGSTYPPVQHTPFSRNAIRSYEKRKASKKNRKDLAVLAKMPLVQGFSSKTFKQQW